ncbi:MAG: response regulator [Methylococcales bacterium]|nr:response regulator [Methylococcales bacterium]
MQENGNTIRLLTYRELLLVLQKLCKEKHSGVMVIKNEADETAEFLLEKGAIFDVVFKARSGKAALGLIKEIKKGHVTFSNHLNQGEIIEKKIALSTVQIFQILTSDIELSAKKSQQNPLKPIMTTNDGLATNSSMIEDVVTNYDEYSSMAENGGMVTIEAQLAAIIGPVAKIVFFDYSKEIIRAANDFKILNAVVEKISKEVLTAEQQKIFRQNILAFISQYNLKGHDAILQALKGSDKKLRLNNSTLGLYVAKYGIQGEFNSLLIDKLLLQIEMAGNLGPSVDLLALLRLLEKSGRTGLLEVREKAKAGGFYFDKGVLINAVECGMNGKIIAMDILQWNHDYLVFRAVAQKKVSRQIQQTVDSLAKEMELLKIDGVGVHKTAMPEYSKADEITLVAKAIELIESCDGARAEKILTNILISHDDNFKAWLWLSRVLTNMTAIELALKKAGHIHSKNADLIEEVRKFTLARKTITSDFVIRCPFCWMPTVEKETECSYCQSNFFIEPNFFKQIGKAKIDILDKAIDRYSHALQKENDGNNQIYLRFYFAMAYLNRQYFQEGLDQFNEITRLFPKNKALNTQGRILTDYMNARGLNFDTAAPTKEKQVSHDTEKLKILVVEDSLVTRKVITRTLVANGYEIFEAKNSFEALNGLEEKKPDMILLDIILPGKDGYEILEEIRQKPIFEKTPVIMLTSRDGLFDKLKGKVSSADEYLTKPFQPDELLTVVRKHFATTQSFSPPQVNEKPEINEKFEVNETPEVNEKLEDSITIPLEPIVEEKIPAKIGLKTKILIVEDSLVTRKVIVRTLVARGYEVFEAKDSFEALEGLEQKNPDLILLDIILPGKDGYEILEEIKQKPLFEHTPVVMLTSRDGLFDKIKGKVSGANEYLTKPFQPEELLTIVRKYLR